MASGNRKNFDKHAIEIPQAAVSFDAEAFNFFLNTQGVRLVHWKALRCPVGMTNVDDNRRPHEDHASCSNGFLYFKAGVVTAGIQGNGNDQQTNDLGFVENSYITATIPQYYDESDVPITIAKYDRFYLDESEPEARITVPTWHLQVCNQSMADKLHYPAVKVEKLVDFRDIEYFEGEDFCIHEGKIKWNGDKWPGFQADVDRGAIYSVRYQYRPYWYCARMLHEIRVAQIETMDGRALKRMPQQILLAREYTFKNESNDSEAKNPESPRQADPPIDGGW